MNEVLFLHNDRKKYPSEIRLCDCFFDFGLQLTKCKKNVEELFSAVEILIITKLITAERVIAFGSDFFTLCCDRIFYWFDDFIDQELIDCVDETDDCQRVIHIKNLLIMSEPPPTRSERFSLDIIIFDRICDNCKKHYIKKISIKFHRIKTSL